MAEIWRVTDEQLGEHLEIWRRQFHNEISPQLHNEAMFSPQWESLWCDVWTNYDTLETLRKERDIPQRAWQKEHESDRQQTENLRQHISSRPFLDADWALCPLGLKLEQYTSAHPSHERGNWQTALERFNQFWRLMHDQEMFRKSLSTTQQVSWTLLEEWWLARYQDSALSNAAIVSLKAAASSPRQPDSSEDEAPQIERSAEVEKSTYHRALFRLFTKEFNPAYWEPHLKDILLSSLKAGRRLALAHASAQRLGYVWYLKLKASPIPDQTSYIGSTQDPCQWLGKRADDKALPYYLWDVVQMRTVVTAELDDEPSYCCVSHTWGRWRKEPAVKIDGVPWRVPQNKRFVVQDLPGHLRRLQSRTQFVWIDLFCIPQDGSPKADEEINRQASIFQNASSCIAWQNDVLGWSVTRDALSWLGFAFLHVSSLSSLYDTGDVLHMFQEKTQKSGELFPAQSDLEIAPDSVGEAMELTTEKAYEEPASWFSSLWTLQETMLCPDMTLVARDWTPLTDPAGTPIPLNAIFSIINTMERMWNNGIPYKPYRGEGMYDPSLQWDRKQYEQWPQAARQLVDLATLTRMDYLFSTSSPTTLLFAANVRQCTGSRAPAIMSALGITDWYTTTKKRDKKLVLDCYPLAFVREAAAKLGASFYTSISRRRKIPGPNQISFDVRDLGSMLPFSTRAGWLASIIAVPQHIEYECEDHPAVASWQIDSLGMVYMKRAGILASSTESYAGELWLTLHEFGSSGATQCNIYDWMSRLPKGQCVYAISLLRDSNVHHGIILQGYKKAWGMQQRLARIGVYYLTNRNMPPTSKIDWLIV